VFLTIKNCGFTNETRREKKEEKETKKGSLEGR
jgi:hypothetical protein